MPDVALMLILGLQILFNLTMVAVVVLLMRRGAKRPATAPVGKRPAQPERREPPKEIPKEPPQHLAGLVERAEEGELVAESQLRERLARFAQGPSR